MTVLTFAVRGIPGAQGSKRHVGHGVMIESSKKVKPWRSDVKSAAEQAMTQRAWHTLAGPTEVTLTFRFRRPKSHYRTGRNAHLLRDNAPLFPTTRNLGDADKLARSTLDALVAAGVMTDDSLVARLFITKLWCDDAGPVGATVVVRRLGVEQVAA